MPPSCTTFHADSSRQPLFSSVVFSELGMAEAETASRRNAQKPGNRRNRSSCMFCSLVSARCRRLFSKRHDVRLAARLELNDCVLPVYWPEIFAINRYLETLQRRAQPVGDDELPIGWFRDHSPAVMRVVRNGELRSAGILYRTDTRVLIANIFIQSCECISRIAFEHFREALGIMRNPAVVTVWGRGQQERHVV